MQLHDPNLHLKLIEMCDCYLETDFPAQLRQAAGEGGDLREGAIKYLALALLHALTEKAGKLTLRQKKGKVTATIKSDADKETIPAPTPELFAEIIAVVRAILHSEADKEKTLLVLGLRSGGVELQVKLDREEDKEELRIKFPQG